MKNFIIIILITFLYSCGYTSVLKDQKNQDLMITIKKKGGDLQTNNFISNQLKLASSSNSINNFDVSFESTYDKEIIAKDSAGIATDFKININVEFTVLSKNNQKINFKESFNIKNNLKNFEQLEYEREIKQNFASSTKDKLILYLISLDDN